MDHEIGPLPRFVIQWMSRTAEEEQYLLNIAREAGGAKEQDERYRYKDCDSLRMNIAQVVVRSLCTNERAFFAVAGALALYAIGIGYMAFRHFHG